MTIAQFHFAFPVRDLDEARVFYKDLIGCSEGRSTWNHVDFDMFGHHVVAHLAPSGSDAASTSEFDGRDVPIPHFGLNLPWREWEQLAARLEAGAARFRDRPHVRHAGKIGEHATLFVFDPSGNALEFKAFRDPSECFRVDPDDVRARVEALLVARFGRIEADLVASGIVDSLGAMELLVLIQEEFGVKLAGVTAIDLATVPRIVALVERARAR
jgi:extradiol dioxygenase family protein/acyl carrier protein